MSFDVRAWYDDNIGYNDNDDDTAPELVASRREWYHFHDPRSEDLPGDTVEKATESIAKLEKYIVDCETRAAAIKKQLSDVSRRGDIKLVDDVEQAGDNPSTLPDDVRPCSIESSSYHYDPCDEKPALITPDCIDILLYVPSSVVVWDYHMFPLLHGEQPSRSDHEKQVLVLKRCMKDAQKILDALNDHIGQHIGQSAKPAYKKKKIK